MKKIALVLVLAAIVAGGAFALDMSAGGGFVYSGNFTSGMSVSAGPVSGEIKMPSHAFGAYGFFDAKYVEASVGLLFGTTKFSVGIPYVASYGVDIDTKSLNFGVLGKYPFALGEKIVLFPALGIEFDYVLSASMGSSSTSDASDLSDLWIRAGVGLDYNITEKLFIRGTLLFGIDLGSQAEEDLAESFGADKNIGFGPKIQVGVGYKF